ncbi:MAG: hypothetical protein Q8N35_07170 [Methylococcaceae bacterium]|jgi:hypothetical protein|nr:hypothetical protein [Methylococcaceae bacterium]MDZ4157542.1 hypothetical protein [Methylococcales bacterium]MDP2394904.1 hypothetical protein [Methylococcaceae bacterium]MDP3019349.1 hypothetical protein [Methylococcaceae bacterium]MDP3389056.1 hypothetical protein [Methylococcaceae bacterium]
MLEITVIIILLIATAVFLKTQKKASDDALKQPPKAAETTTRQPEVAVAAVEPKIEVETDAAEAEGVQPVIALQNEAPVVIAPVINAVEPELQASLITPNYSLLPEDSVLKRHYFSQIQTLLEESLPTKPSDATLKRHYEAVLTDKLEQVLNDKHLLNQLLEGQRRKEEVAQPAQEVKQPELAIETPVAAEPSISQTVVKIPEDSVLKRHYFAHIRAVAEADLSPKPTDSVLLRHWQALSDEALKKLL